MMGNVWDSGTTYEMGMNLSALRKLKAGFGTRLRISGLAQTIDFRPIYHMEKLFRTIKLLCFILYTTSLQEISVRFFGDIFVRVIKKPDTYFLGNIPL